MINLKDSIDIIKIPREVKSKSTYLQDRKIFSFDELSFRAKDIWLSLDFDLDSTKSNNHVLQFLDGLIKYYEYLFEEDFPEIRVNIDDGLNLIITICKDGLFLDNANLYFLNKDGIYYKSVFTLKVTPNLCDFDFNGFNSDLNKDLCINKSDIISLHEYLN